MFYEFGHHKKGYQEMDLVKILNHITGTDFSDYFKEHFDSNIDLIPQLSEAIKDFGLELELKNSDKIWESQFGFKLQLQNTMIVVVKILPFSCSYRLLELNDVLISVNQRTITALNHADIFDYYASESVELTINRNGKILNLRLIPDLENGFKKVEIKNQESKIE
jgi:predicted metalloprotease with PDZ domain